MRKKLFLVTVMVVMVVLVSALIFGGCAKAPAPAPAPGPAPAPAPAPGPAPAPAPAAPKILKIGGIAMLTGPGSPGGLAAKQGWELAVDKYNEAGGVKIAGDTYTIKLIVEDDQMSAEVGATAAKKLITEDRVNFVMGGLTEAIKPAIYDITAKYGVLYPIVDSVNCSYGIGGVGDIGPGKLMIRTQPGFSEKVDMVLDYLIKQYPNVKTVGQNRINENENAPIDDVVRKACLERGLRTVGEVVLIDPTILDYYPIMTRQLESKPDAIMNTVAGPTTPGLELKVLRELGFKGPVFWCGKSDPVFQMVIAGPDTTDIFGPGLVVADPNLPAAAKEVMARAEKKYAGQQIISDVLYFYDGLSLLLQTFEKAPSLDPQAVIKIYESLTQPGSLQSIFGPAHVGGLKTYGLNRVICLPIPLGQVMNGVPSCVGYFPLEIP